MAEGASTSRNLARTGRLAVMEGMAESLRALPGAELVERGLTDLETGTVSEEALLVSIGAPRLTMLGIAVLSPHHEPEHQLYALLDRRHGDSAHSRYNALVRRLVSFERALACVR